MECSFIYDLFYFYVKEKVGVVLTAYAGLGGCIHTSLLRLLHLEDIARPLLDNSQRYQQLFGAYRAMMDEIALAYSHNCDNPPLDRDMPPYAGAKNLILPYMNAMPYMLAISVNTEIYDSTFHRNLNWANPWENFTSNHQQLAATIRNFYVIDETDSSLF